jgi:hypothetical protein
MKLNLSKSQYLKGIYCNRRLWLYKVEKMQEEYDAGTQVVMDTGTSIGELAQSLYPNGVLIDEEYNKIREGENRTKEEINKGTKTIFEATAINPEGCYCRIDILHKVNKDSWDLIEVKSSKKIDNNYYYDDLAFQRYVFESAGYKIRKSILMHINGEYIKKGDIEPKKLFKQTDLTDDVLAKLDEIKKNIKKLKLMLSEKNGIPDRLISPKHCGQPYDCGYHEHCWKDIPEYSLLNVLSSRKSNTKLGKLREELFESRIYSVDKLPEDFKLNDNELIDLTSYKEDRTIVNKEKVKEFLDSLVYPIYYFDYETINPTIPIYDGTHPFEVIPFQFSLHIQQKNGKLEHVEFLHEERTDPREPLIKCLIKNIGKKGTVLAHHSSFEKSRNNDLAKAFPKYKKELEAINERLVDSKIPFSNRWVYNHKTIGSASLKVVLPVYCPHLSYEDLEIQEGGTASEEYLRAISPQTSKTERKKIYKNLKEYCGLDTYAVVHLISKLRAMV